MTVELLNQKETMTGIVRKCAGVFGLCVTIVTLCSGCATGAPPAGQINLSDLDSMTIDCSRKAEQIAFLQSLRRPPDEKLFSANGWFGYNDRLHQIINHQLRYLANYC